MHESELRRLAAEKFGWSELRPEQVAAMERVMAGHDVLAVLPTGAGKSAIYQVPALLLDGPTVVVSPLIALQNDQIGGLDDSRAPRAVAVNSAQPAGERRESWAAVREGAAEYVFLAPEQLAKDEVVDGLAGLGVSLFVVDEAHCVSAWGHDFRPEYLRLDRAIERLGRPRVLALTATAAPPVRRDIITRLGMRDHREVIAGFDRPNLRLAVRRFTSDREKREAVIAHVRDLAERGGLLYTATRKDAESYAEALSEAGVRATAYHAGMRPAERERAHEDFLSGAVDVVAATSAFGMGIDKPDVRFVAHASAPESLDTYYQQIGRAGRDGDPADTTLFYRPEDLGLQRFLTARGPKEDALAEAARAAARDRLDEVDPSPRAVALLEQVGAVTGGGLAEGTTPEQAVDDAVEAAEAHQRMVRSRIQMMRAYAETTECLRQHLLAYFGEHLGDPCGNCDSCEAGTAQRRPAAAGEYPVDSRVRHPEFGVGVVISTQEDRVTVLFEDVGYKTLSLTAVKEQDLLAPAGG